MRDTNTVERVYVQVSMPDGGYFLSIYLAQIDRMECEMRMENDDVGMQMPIWYI